MWSPIDIQYTTEDTSGSTSRHRLAGVNDFQTRVHFCPSPHTRLSPHIVYFLLRMNYDKLKRFVHTKNSKNTSGEFVSIVLSNVTSEGDLNTHNIHNYIAVCTVCILFVEH
jgi:hypothetical protein